MNNNLQGFKGGFARTPGSPLDPPLLRLVWEWDSIIRSLTYNRGRGTWESGSLEALCSQPCKSICILKYSEGRGGGERVTRRIKQNERDSKAVKSVVCVCGRGKGRGGGGGESERVWMCACVCAVAKEEEDRNGNQQSSTNYNVYTSIQRILLKRDPVLIILDTVYIEHNHTPRCS